MKEFDLIKTSLVNKLKKVIDQEVFFEELSQVNDLEDYWFVEIMPVSNTAIGSIFKQISYLVAITCSVHSPTNAKYMQMLHDLDPLLCPCFKFGSRAVTINDTTFTIVDDLAHYSFKIEYIPDVELKDGETATSLEVNYKGG